MIASDRSDTVVTVSPTTGKAADRRGVDDTKVTFDNERLSIIGPKPRISWIGPSTGESVEVTVELPTGSRLTAEIAVGSVHTTGELGATRIKGATGAVSLDGVGDLWLRAAHGGVTVARANGNIDVTAAYGQIKVGTVTGDALLKSSYGGVLIGEIGGDLDARLSYGDLDIAAALGSVTAKTAFGTILLGEVSSGSIQVDSGFGADRDRREAGRSRVARPVLEERSRAQPTRPRSRPRPVRTVRRGARPYPGWRHHHPARSLSGRAPPRSEGQENADDSSYRRESAIHVRGLTKSYAKVTVLRGVDFDVSAGSIFALLGSNGAGKTTVITILSTLLAADGGEASVNGFDVATRGAEVRASISLTGQFAASTRS